MQRPLKPTERTESGERLSVLLVENDPVDAELCLRELAAAGFDLTADVVQTRDEVRRRLSSRRRYDMVLSDYNLMDWTGMDVLKELRDLHADLPFILVSGALGDEAAVECIKQGASDYVLKDRLARLPLAVRRAIEDGRLSSERARAEAEIRRLNAELEQRVQARTAELEAANRKLESEIMDRVWAESALDSLRRQHERILNAAGEGICRIGVTGQCTFANPAAARMLGWEVRELIGRDLHAVVHPSCVGGAACARNLWAATESIDASARPKVEPALFQRKDGTEFPVERVCTSIVENDQPAGTVIVLTDATERRAIERMKDDFLSLVSHELRTPLTSIHGALRLVASGALRDQPRQAKRMVEVAVVNTDRLVRLVNDVLDIERMEAGEFAMTRKNVKASALLREAVELMQPAAEKARVFLAVAPGDAGLSADPDRIIQALSNLLSNAIKFSPPGSTVLLQAEQESDCVRFTIRDSGRGIPAGKLETIFERFQQVDASDRRKNGGAGLGLFICRRVIEQHGGRIWAESRLGEGSSFIFTLPQQPADQVAADRAGGGSPEQSPTASQAIRRSKTNKQSTGW